MILTQSVLVSTRISMFVCVFDQLILNLASMWIGFIYFLIFIKISSSHTLCLSHVDMNFGTEKSSLNFHLSIPKNLRRTKHKRKFSFELIRLYKNISTLYASTSSRFFMTFKNHLRMMIES